MIRNLATGAWAAPEATQALSAIERAERLLRNMGGPIRRAMLEHSIAAAKRARASGDPIAILVTENDLASYE